MPRLTFFGLVGLFLALLTLPQPVAAQPIDRWHYIDPESVLHTDRVDGLQGAGVIQGDATFAMLYLGLPEENGVVSVALPSGSGASELSSTLITTRGQRFERELLAEELDIVQLGDKTFAYSFPITPTDVDLFKSAQTWILSIGDQSWPITLSGSRAAIDKAERKHADLFERLAESPPATQVKASD